MLGFEDEVSPQPQTSSDGLPTSNELRLKVSQEWHIIHIVQ